MGSEVGSWRPSRSDRRRWISVESGGGGGEGRERWRGSDAEKCVIIRVVGGGNETTTK